MAKNWFSEQGVQLPNLDLGPALLSFNVLQWWTQSVWHMSKYHIFILTMRNPWQILKMFRNIWQQPSGFTNNYKSALCDLRENISQFLNFLLNERSMKQENVTKSCFSV